MSGVPRLLLFDVDGTLVLGRRENRRWFGEALVEVFGDAGDIDGHSFSGKIDPQIVTELVTGAGAEPAFVEAGIPRVREAYLRRLRANLTPDHLRLLPHVPALLERLRVRGEATLGLLTGNWEEGARTKLACFDLNRFFPFGAFSDGHRERRDLPPVALERAAATTGRTFTAAETLIIGDSPLDVDCAHQHGMRCLAVGTGYTSLAELEAAGADWVLPDLGEAHRVDPVFRL
jgi:phosphoglycolate phosphatase-like HAD superfamily hydrolase